MLRAFGLSDIGCVRHNNEDTFELADDIGLYVVADGMGGAEAGEVAARLAVEAVIHYFRQTPTTGLPALCRAFEQAHLQVLNAAAYDSGLRGMGCTLVAALCDRESVFLANVGDSRAYVFDNRGCEFVTSDQTWVNEVARGLGLSSKEIKQHPLRHVLTVAIGSEGAFRVNSKTLPLRAGARILLCTDGLHDVVADSEIADIMMRRSPVDVKCRLLVEAAKNAGGPDNITVAIFENGY
jgi:PPM family protein phosphatase